MASAVSGGVPLTQGGMPVPAGAAGGPALKWAVLPPRPGFLGRYWLTLAAAPPCAGGSGYAAVSLGGFALAHPVVGTAVIGGLLVPLAIRKIYRCFFEWRLKAASVPVQISEADAQTIQEMEQEVGRLKQRLTDLRRGHPYYIESRGLVCSSFHVLADVERMQEYVGRLNAYRTEVEGRLKDFRKWLGVEQMAAEDGVVEVKSAVEGEVPEVKDIDIPPDPVLAQMERIEKDLVEFMEEADGMQRIIVDGADENQIIEVFVQELKDGIRVGILASAEVDGCEFVGSVFRDVVRGFNCEENYENLRGRLYAQLVQVLRSYQPGTFRSLKETGLVVIKKCEVGSLGPEWIALAAPPEGLLPGPNAEELQKEEGSVFQKTVIGLDRMDMFSGLIERMFQREEIEESLKCLMIGAALKRIETRVDALHQQLNQFDFPGARPKEDRSSRRWGCSFQNQAQVVAAQRFDRNMMSDEERLALTDWQKDVETQRPPVVVGGNRKVHFVTEEETPPVNALYEGNFSILNCDSFSQWKARQDFIVENRQSLEALPQQIRALSIMENRVFRGQETERFHALLHGIEALRMRMDKQLSRLDVLQILDRYAFKNYFHMPMLTSHANALRFVQHVFDSFLTKTVNRDLEEHFKQLFQEVFVYLEKLRWDSRKPLEETELVQVSYEEPRMVNGELCFSRGWQSIETAAQEHQLHSEQFHDLVGRRGEKLTFYTWVSSNVMRKFLGLLNFLQRDADFKTCLFTFWRFEIEEPRTQAAQQQGGAAAAEGDDLVQEEQAPVFRGAFNLRSAIKYGGFNVNEKKEREIANLPSKPARDPVS